MSIIFKSERDTLIDTAKGILRCGLSLDLTMVARLMEEGVDVEALEASCHTELQPV